MNNLRISLLVLVTATALCAAPVRATPATARGADEAAIRTLYDGYDRAWTAGDTQRLAAVWATDAEHVEPDGRVLTGRAAIAQSLGARLAADLKGTQSKQRVESIRFLTPDVAAVDATYEVTGAHDAAGNALPTIHGRYLDVWQKRAGAWHIVLDRPVTAPHAPQ